MATIHLYEYTSGGSAFRDPFTATGPDHAAGDATLVYGLTGADSASFSIDTGTGQLYLASGATRGAIAKSSRRFTITATDKDSKVGSIAIKLEVRKCVDGIGFWCGTVKTATLAPNGDWGGYGLSTFEFTEVSDDGGSLQPNRYMKLPGGDVLQVVFLARNRHDGKARLQLVRDANSNEPTQAHLDELTGYALRYGHWALKSCCLFPLSSSYWLNPGQVGTVTQGGRYEWGDCIGISWSQDTEQILEIVPRAPTYPAASRTIDVQRNTLPGTMLGEPVVPRFFLNTGLIYELAELPGQDDTRHFESDASSGQLSLVLQPQVV